MGSGLYAARCTRKSRKLRAHFTARPRQTAAFQKRHKPPAHFRAGGLFGFALWFFAGGRGQGACSQPAYRVIGSVTTSCSRSQGIVAAMSVYQPSNT